MVTWRYSRRSIKLIFDSINTTEGHSPYSPQKPSVLNIYSPFHPGCTLRTKHINKRWRGNIESDMKPFSFQRDRKQRLQTTSLWGFFLDSNLSRLTSVNTRQYLWKGAFDWAEEDMAGVGAGYTVRALYPMIIKPTSQDCHVYTVRRPPTILCFRPLLLMPYNAIHQPLKGHV